MTDHTSQQAATNLPTLRDRIARAIEHKVKQHPMPNVKPWDPPGAMAFWGCSFLDVADAVVNVLHPTVTDGREELIGRERRIAELEAENARLRTRQEYATSDWCRPAGLDAVLDSFERDHRPWPQVPEMRAQPIPGHVRHTISLLAHAITRACLEQADLRMRLDTQETPDGR